jgi:acetyl esterase/lipase
MATWRLWDEQIEALRPQAREAVAAGMGPLAIMLGREDSPPADPFERARRQRERYEASFAPSPEVHDREIAGVRCRVFRPKGDVRAVYLHFHGGGMVTGAPEMNDLGNVMVGNAFGLAVVSVDYRLAPEHPFPAGPDDGFAVATWLVEHGAVEFGSGRMVIGGESAGGYLAAAVLLRMRDAGIAGGVLGANLVFGIFDWGRSPSQRGLRPHVGPDVLDPEGLEFFQQCFLPDMTDDQRRDPRISPAFADLSDLPPALFSVGSTDHLLDDTLMTAVRWSAFGNDTEVFVAPDMPHAFMAFSCAITDSWGEVTRNWLTRILAA